MSSDEKTRSVMQPLGDDWYAVMEWPAGVEDGGPGTLVIKPVGAHPVGGLSSTVLRQIDFRKAIDALREAIAADHRRSGEHAAVDRWYADRLRSALADGVTDDYLALLSSEYVRAVKRGQARVNDYLAEVVGKPVSTVRGHLWQARTREFLSGSPGRKGGNLGPDAEAIMKRIDAQTADSFLEALEGAHADDRSRRPGNPHRADT
jgi:hypothetical protein